MNKLFKKILILVCIVILIGCLFKVYSIYQFSVDKERYQRLVLNDSEDMKNVKLLLHKKLNIKFFYNNKIGALVSDQKEIEKFFPNFYHNGFRMIKLIESNHCIIFMDGGIGTTELYYCEYDSTLPLKESLNNKDIIMESYLGNSWYWQIRYM